MKKRKEGKLNLDRETLRHLESGQRVAGGRGTLTLEGGCDSEVCPETGTGCTASTVSCSQ